MGGKNSRTGWDFSYGVKKKFWVKMVIFVYFGSYFGTQDFGKCHIKNVNISKISDIFRLFGRPVYQFGHPNAKTQKNFSRFFFSVVI